MRGRKGMYVKMYSLRGEPGAVNEQPADVVAAARYARARARSRIHTNTAKAHVEKRRINSVKVRRLKKVVSNGHLKLACTYPL